MNKNISGAGEKALKRRKIVQDVLKTISFYENKKTAGKGRRSGSAVKAGSADSAEKGIDYSGKGRRNGSAVKAGSADSTEKCIDYSPKGRRSGSAVKAGSAGSAGKEKDIDYSAKGRRSGSAVKAGNVDSTVRNSRKSVWSESSRHKTGRIYDSHENTDRTEPFELSDEEKSALDVIIRQLQNLDADEMHEITYDKKLESITIVEKKESFLDFETEFDPVMLWKDTNLDDYADLFSPKEIEMLKEKQKMFINGTYVKNSANRDSDAMEENQKLNVQEDDFADEAVSEEDFADETVSEEDFVDKAVSEDDFADETVSEEDFVDEAVSEDDYSD